MCSGGPPESTSHDRHSSTHRKEKKTFPEIPSPSLKRIDCVRAAGGGEFPIIQIDVGHHAYPLEEAEEKSVLTAPVTADARGAAASDYYTRYRGGNIRYIRTHVRTCLQQDVGRQGGREARRQTDR